MPQRGSPANTIVLITSSQLELLTSQTQQIFQRKAASTRLEYAHLLSLTIPMGLPLFLPRKQGMNTCPVGT